VHLLSAGVRDPAAIRGNVKEKPVVRELAQCRAVGRGHPQTRCPTAIRREDDLIAQHRGKRSWRWQDIGDRRRAAAAADREQQGGGSRGEGIGVPYRYLRTSAMVT
jgi:hypothetical protein